MPAGDQAAPSSAAWPAAPGWLLDLLSRKQAARRSSGSTTSAIPTSRTAATARAASRSAPTAWPRCWKRPRPALAKPLQPKTEAEVGKLRAKLNYAGFRSEAAPSIFLGLKIDRPGGRLPRRRRHDAASPRASTTEALHVHRRHRRRRVLPARRRALVHQARRGKTTSSSACPTRST